MYIKIGTLMFSGRRESKCEMIIPLGESSTSSTKCGKSLRVLLNEDLADLGVLNNVGLGLVSAMMPKIDSSQKKLISK